MRKHAKKGFCGDLLKGLGSNSGNKSLVSDLSKSEFLACLYGYIRDFEDEEPTDDKATEEIIKKLVDVVSDGEIGDTLRAQQELYAFYRREYQITSRIFRTFFWGSPGQVLLCLKSGHHGRLSR